MVKIKVTHKKKEKTKIGWKEWCALPLLNIKEIKAKIKKIIKTIITPKNKALPPPLKICLPLQHSSQTTQKALLNEKPSEIHPQQFSKAQTTLLKTAINKEISKLNINTR